MKNQIWILSIGMILTACTAPLQPTTTASDSPAPDSPQPTLTSLPAESPPPRR